MNYFKVPAFYTTPTAQVVLVSLTCFATVGMFQAVVSLGAGGTQDVGLSDIANGVLYGVFALAGLVSGVITNLLGPQRTLFLGTLGYALYVGSLWCFQTQGTQWFLILAGAILGATAALLWSAQGAIMMSYPLEKDKGKAFAIFWAIYNLGSFIGDVITLGINIKSGGVSTVSTKTYIAFLLIIGFGVASAFLVLPPNRVIREDGTVVNLQAASVRSVELHGMAKLFVDWRMLALLPMFFASNYYNAYIFGINAVRFDGATRALNATLLSVGAIVGGVVIGYLVLDVQYLRRHSRGYLGLFVVAVMTIITWGCALVWQLTFTRQNVHNGGTISLINYRDKEYRGKGALFFFFYFSAACYTALIYWIMSALTNDPFTLARYAGFYKAIQSAGAAGSFGMDATATPYLNEHLVSWILMLLSFPSAFLVVRSIKDTNYEVEKVVYVEALNTSTIEDRNMGSIIVEQADNEERTLSLQQLYTQVSTQIDVQRSEPNDAV